MKWNENNIFKIFFPPTCLGVLIEGMESSFTCLRVQVRGNQMVKREYSFSPKRSKSQIFVPPNWEEQKGMDLSLMKILLKFLNYPLNLSPLYSQLVPIYFFLIGVVPIFLLSLCRSFLMLLQPYPTVSFSIVLISLIYWYY